MFLWVLVSPSCVRVWDQDPPCFSCPVSAPQAAGEEAEAVRLSWAQQWLLTLFPTPSGRRGRDLGMGMGTGHSVAVGAVGAGKGMFQLWGWMPERCPSWERGCGY